MSRRKGKNAVTWLFLTVFFSALLLTGCGAPKYEAVTLNASENGEGSSLEGENESPAEAGKENSSREETMVSLTLGNMDGSGNGESLSGESGRPDDKNSGGEDPVVSYENVDEVVVVTADVLNVRESESQNARIYAQLRKGSTLRRTGYDSQWSRVNYDGKTAYVSSDLVEVQEPESLTEPEPPEEPESPAEPDNGGHVPSGAGEAAGSGAAAVRAAVPMDGADAAPQTGEPEIPFNGHTVAIDAGHQAKANSEKEPIGPGSKTMKVKMPESNTGTLSGVREHELTLSVAKKLEAELKNRGYHVVMIREGNDVNLSNGERASIANKSEAEIFIRLHANSMDNSSVYGALAMCMTDQNPYNANLYQKSYALSKKIIDNICTHTGTKNRGVQEVDNSSGINWSEIPVSVVEMGFMSNPDEDRWMQEESYQGKIVAGIAAAVDSYFAEGN